MQSKTRQAISLLLRAAASEKSHLRAGVFWLACAAGLEALGPLLSKALIDNYLLPRHLELAAMAGIWVIVLVSGCGASWLRYLQLIRLAGVAMRSVQGLRKMVYEHVLRLPMSFFDQAITGQLVSRVTNDTESVKALYIQVLFVMLDSSIVVLGAIAAMLWLDWRLAGIVLLLIPVVTVIVLAYQRMSAPAVARAKELRSAINAQIAESIHGMSVLQATHATREFSVRFEASNGKHYHERLAELRANAWLLRPALDMLNVILLVAVIYSFGMRSLAGYEIGVLYAFVSYITRVIDPLIQITLQFSQLQQALIGAARVNTLLEELMQPAQSGTKQLAHGAVELRDIQFAYKTDHMVLHDLSIEIPDGSYCGIVGHTGSGKSTVLSLLLRFYRAQSGAIRLGGQRLEEISDSAFRQQVGLVPQEPYLLAASARENIAMGRHLSDAQVEAAARAANIHETIMQLEQGYATPLGEGGGRLSTGQKQLIAIARAIAGEPKILLLDEATSHIDSETEQIVQSALNRLRGKVTIIAIAHRLSTIRDADQIIVLNHGHVAERGQHGDLMQIEEGIYRKLYLLQQIDEEETACAEQYVEMDELETPASLT